MLFFPSISAPPKFVKSEIEDTLTLKAGASTAIELPFTANPQPKVTWQYNGGKLPDPKRMKYDIIYNMTSFTLAKAQRKDAGDYSVTLENEFGKGKITVKIIVLGNTSTPIIVAVCTRNCSK